MIDRNPSSPATGASADDAGVPCDQATLVNPYYDGELAEAEQRDFEAHLQSCGYCTAMLAGLRRLSQTLSRAERPGPSPEAMKRLYAAVESEPRLRIGHDTPVDEDEAALDAPDAWSDRILSLTRTVRRLTAVAAAVLIAGSALLFYQMRDGNADGRRGTSGPTKVLLYEPWEQQVVMPGNGADPRREAPAHPSHLARWIMTDLSTSGG